MSYITDTVLDSYIYCFKENCQKEHRCLRLCITGNVVHQFWVSMFCLWMSERVTFSDKKTHVCSHSSVSDIEQGTIIRSNKMNLLQVCTPPPSPARKTSVLYRCRCQTSPRISVSTLFIGTVINASGNTFLICYTMNRLQWYRLSYIISPTKGQRQFDNHTFVLSYSSVFLKRSNHSKCNTRVTTNNVLIWWHVRTCCQWFDDK